MSEVMFFIDDKNGKVSEAFATEGVRCLAWHANHSEGSEMYVTPANGGLVLLAGGKFDEMLRVLVEFLAMTGDTVKSVHSLSSKADQLLPLTYLHPEIVTKDTLVIPHGDHFNVD